MDASSSLILFHCDADTTEGWVSGPGTIIWGPDNISADPLFCDPVSCSLAPTASGNYCLQPTSPCLPGQNPGSPEGGLIGAKGEGCAGPSHTVPTTWGLLKNLFWLPGEDR